MSQTRFTQSLGKRVVFEAQGSVSIEEFAFGEPGKGRVLVETVRTLISPGTETAFLMALPNTPGKFPMYPGYSNAGIVSSVGSEVSKIRTGDRVASRAGHASHVTVREDELTGIPEGLSLDEASFFTLGSIALQGIRKADIEIGESVVVLGQGLVGNLALQLAKLGGGMPVIGVDTYDYRLAVSQKCCADHVLNSLQVNLEKAVMDLTEGRGADVVVEATGNPDAVPTALKLVSQYGRVILLGSTRGTSHVDFYSTVHRKGATIIGAHDSTRPRYESHHGWWTAQKDSSLVLKLISRGSLKVKDLITDRLSFWKAEEAYRRLIESKDTTLGIILEWKNP